MFIWIITIIYWCLQLIRTFVRKKKYKYYIQNVNIWNVYRNHTSIYLNQLVLRVITFDNFLICFDIDCFK